MPLNRSVDRTPSSVDQSRRGIDQAIEPFIAPVGDLAPRELFEPAHHLDRAGFGREFLNHVRIGAPPGPLGMWTNPGPGSDLANIWAISSLATLTSTLITIA